MSNNHLDHHDPIDPGKPVLERIHPWIYAIAVGLVAWFALAAWSCLTTVSVIEVRYRFRSP